MVWRAFASCIVYNAILFFNYLQHVFTFNLLALPETIKKLCLYSYDISLSRFVCESHCILPCTSQHLSNELFIVSITRPWTSDVLST